MPVKTRLLAAAVMLGSGAAQAAPADVNAQSFYTTARALEAKGVGAAFDSRLKPLRAQMLDAAERARAANRAATAAGTPLYCVPEGTRRKGMGPRQVIDLLGKVPDAERRQLTLAEAWKRALARAYPCP
jgi:hypothetical protein